MKKVFSVGDNCRREHIDPEQVSLLFDDASLVMKSVIDEMERKMRESVEKAVTR